jgi:hypothetical protein
LTTLTSKFLTTYPSKFLKSCTYLKVPDELCLQVLNVLHPNVPGELNFKVPDELFSKF